MIMIMIIIIIIISTAAAATTTTTTTTTTTSIVVRAGPRNMVAPGRLIIWRPGQVNNLAPKFFWPRTGLANFWGRETKLRIIIRRI